MAFSPPVRSTPDRIRQFNGIGGPATQVIILKGADDGRDYSNSVANEVQDFFLGERGSLQLRRGFAKADATGKTQDIVGIFQVTISGVQQYGILYAGGIDLIGADGLLENQAIPIPALPSLPVSWPAAFPQPEQPVDEVPVSDPALPLDEQACTNGYEWVSSPDTITFGMPYGGPVPSNQFWYWGLRGYSAGYIFSGSLNADPAWLTTTLGGYRQWQTGPCYDNNIQQLLVAINGKDSSGNWLAPGAYSFNKGVTYNDGTTKSFNLGLTVYAQGLAISPTSYTKSVIVGYTGSQTQVIAVTNDGEMGSICWSAAITGDAVLTAKMSLDVSSGSLAAGASENATLTISDPAALGAGTYNAVITFSEPSGQSEVMPVQIVVIPHYTGLIHMQGSVKFSASPNPPETDAVYDADCCSISHQTRSPYYSIQYYPSRFVEFFFDTHPNHYGIWSFAWAGHGAPQFDSVPTFRADGCPTASHTFTARWQDWGIGTCIINITPP